MQIFINKTHLFSVSFVIPAARMSSMATGVVGLSGAAVWLTAAVVPSHELKIRFERWVDGTWGDGNHYNGCSDGASAAGGGLGGGRKGAGGFSP
jgi:hypothetical protein